MSKKPNLPGSGDKPTGRDISEILKDTVESAPDDWDDVGTNAAEFDEEELPRREQMNLDIAHDVKAEFYELVDEKGMQLRFVVEDLIRLYLDHMKSDS